MKVVSISLSDDDVKIIKDYYGDYGNEQSIETFCIVAVMERIGKAAKVGTFDDRSV